MHEYRAIAAKDIRGGSNKGFGIVFCVFFAIIALWPVLFGNELRVWALACSFMFGFLAFAFPGALTLPNKIWTRFGLMLHIVTTPIIMGFIFFGVITPLAIIMRVLGKKTLALEYSPRSSYWIQRTPPGPKPDSFTHQF
jgi:hypothetical protein